MRKHMIKRMRKAFCRKGQLGRLFLCGVLILGLTGCQKTEEPSTTETTYETFEETVAQISPEADTGNENAAPIQLTFWYHDEKAAPYYEAAAADFHDRYGVEVLCSYVGDVDYLETINQANIDGTGPDLFIASNDEVRKLHMAGLAEENSLYTDGFWEKHYPEVARRALTSEGTEYGYPIYFDTCVMIYDASVTTQPETFGSITDFAVNFVDETNSKVIFRWDIADPFCDYLFLGTGAELLGDYGEDNRIFNVNNAQVVQNMTYYQSLHEYFSMDVDTSTYEQVKSELVNGTLVYGIVKTDVAGELETYGSSYALCPVPALSGELSVQDLSITYGAFVSPFTKQSEYANLFAAYLSYEYAENQFSFSHQVSARASLEREDGNERIIYDQYVATVPVPKALENGDFWIYTEICFKNIWNGKDVTAELNGLQEIMQSRLK